MRLNSFRVSLEGELESAEMIIAGAQPGRSRGELPLGAREFRGHYYKVFILEKKLNWDEAKALCERNNGGYPACVTSKAEDDFINELRAEAQADRRVWIGGDQSRRCGGCRLGKWRRHALPEFFSES